MYCTVAQVRAANKKLADSAEVPDAVITSRIGEADNTVKIDLSAVASPSELDALGAGSYVLNLLSIWKTVEITLASYFSAARNVDETNDIDYWMKKYNDVIAKILDGTIKITGSTEAVDSGDYPGIVASTRFYRRKGVSGFYPDGSTVDYVDEN